MLFSGVRNSWLMFARNAALATFAASASSRLRRSHSSMRMRGVMSTDSAPMPATRPCSSVTGKRVVSSV